MVTLLTVLKTIPDQTTGIIKTHRLLLLTPTSLMTPGVPVAPHESRLTIGPKAIKAIIEHFPPARGPKSDPQLIWKFGETEVDVKSHDHSIDAKGGIFGIQPSVLLMLGRSCSTLH